MVQINNTRSLSLEERTKLYQKEESVARANRESVESNSKVSLKEDKLEIRRDNSADISQIGQDELLSVLSNLSSSLINNSEEAVNAHGNISAESVLALLND